MISNEMIAWITIAVFSFSLALMAFTRLLAGNDRLRLQVGMVLFALYILVILYETLLFRPSYHQFKIIFSPLFSYRYAFSLYEEGKGFGLYITNSRMLKLIILNILLYIPFGYLLPLARPKLLQPGGTLPWLRRYKFPWIAVLAGMALSIVIEFIQLISQLGYFELDDILNNTIGSLLGVALYQFLIRPKHKTVE